MANGLFNLKQVMQAVQQGGWPNQRTPSVEYLVVAGGGGGGCNTGGGGGGGGLLTGIDPVPNGQTLLVTVGAGGAGVIGDTTISNSGTNSVFGSISATGGGGGGGYGGTTATTSNGLSGGSGGGAGNTGSQAGGSAVFGQGNAGATTPSSLSGSPYVGSGGGGAGTVGLPAASTSVSGNGGAGIASAILGTTYVWAGGGGGSPFPLAPSRIVTTDALGAASVGPYMNPVNGFVSLFAAPTTNDFEVSRNVTGTVNVLYRNTNNAANGNVAVTLSSAWSLGRVYHQYGNATGTFYSVGVDQNSDYVIADGAGLPASYLMQISRFGGGSQRQASFLGATATSTYPFHVSCSRAAGTYEYRFVLVGGASNDFVFLVDDAGAARHRVIADADARFRLETAADSFEIRNDNSGSIQLYANQGARFVVNTGSSGGIFSFQSGAGNSSNLWLENLLFTYRAFYIDPTAFSAPAGVNNYGDMWFEDNAGTRTVQFRLRRGGVDYTASLTLV